MIKFSEKRIFQKKIEQFSCQMQTPLKFAVIFKRQGYEEVLTGMNGIVRARGTDSAKVIPVIETIALRGEGTETDKCRQVTQYWSFEGELLAERDPCEKEKE